MRAAPCLTLGLVRRRILPILATLAGACVVGLLIYGVSAQSANRTRDELLARGERPAAPAAARELPLLGAGARSSSLGAAAQRSLASLHGEVVLLNFWASWCVPCQAEAPLLERAQPQLERHDATVLGVTYEDASPDSEAFVRRFHITYPSLRDATGEFARSYGTRQVPESFLIDRDGRVVAISRGEIAAPFVRAALKLAERT